jgi:hypothetical protein
VSHHELPLPDFDQLPVTSVEARVRSLTEEQLDELLDYEQQHASRIQVVQILETRLDEVRAGAPLTEGSADPTRPEAVTSPGGTSATQTEGPPVNPPSQGDPTNPAQPRG